MTRSVRTTLAAAFAALTLVIVALAGFSLFAISRMGSLSAEVDRVWLPRLDAAHTVNARLGDVRIAEAVMVMAIDNLERTEGEAVMNRSAAAVAEQLEKLRTGAPDARHAAAVDDLAKALKDYQAVNAEVSRLAGAIFGASASDLFQKRGRETFEATRAKVADVVALTVDGAQAAALQADRMRAQALTWASALALAGILMAAAAVAYVFRGLAAALARVAGATQRIGAGALETPVPDQGRRDEI
ncbi:MAG TPA: MCP four helix bundle domain-containing protein, partial [Salinarimonas sp.]|nr:MCP four helix bundle domain-containing protein [Salinarimonas sp.]